MQITGTYVRYFIGQRSLTGLGLIEWVSEGPGFNSRILITERVVASRSIEVLIPRPCLLVEKAGMFER